MEIAYIARMAPATIDLILLAGLRGARGPVDERAIPDRCHIRYQTTPKERDESLRRLVARGLIARRVIREPHGLWPLLEMSETVAYGATGGGE